MRDPLGPCFSKRVDVYVGYDLREHYVLARLQVPPEVRIDVGALAHSQREDHEEKGQRKDASKRKDASNAQPDCRLTLSYHCGSDRVPLSSHA